MATGRQYPLPEGLARYAAGEAFSPDRLCRACREAGEGLGRADAGRARFRSAAEMVGMWRGLDLPGWEAPYVLRDARLGYLRGYERAVVSGGLSEREAVEAARARWGDEWRERLAASRSRERRS